MKQTRWVMIRFALVLGFACMSMAFNSARKAEQKANDQAMSEKSDDWVWISKADGSKQCEDGGNPVEADAAELKKAGIDVIESKKHDDGMMRIQMCGAPAGKENAYRIKRQDAGKAAALGFREHAANPSSPQKK